LGCHEVLQDDQSLYVIIPYCRCGSLYSKIVKKEQTIIHSPRTVIESPPNKFTSKENHHNIDYEHEDQVRSWFRQILQALSHLQKKGVSHLDLCLENVLLIDDENIAITDFGYGIRIPYDDDSNVGFISDVSQGSQRRLVKCQRSCGRLSYLAPEIIEGGTDSGFDGFAADLWSAGVVLFICLVGSAPFKWPHRTDCHYSLIKQGKLHQLLKESNVTISPEACDLLQNMLWRNPCHRLILSDICSHPWVVGTSCCTKEILHSPRTVVTPTEPLCEVQTPSKRPPLIPSLHPREDTR
jgi:serine/threonine protein kinase